MRSLLVVHGGAGSLPSEEDRLAYREGVTAALDVGRAELGRGARAAALAAVTYLESHTITNAGRGAALAVDGTVALDAGFMDGATRRYGAVTGVRRFENPVLLAVRLGAEGDYGRFVGPPDADALIEEFGHTPCDPEQLVTERARRLHAERVRASQDTPRASWLDTVGAVALDADGHVVAAVSTGGMSMKRRGRIGDSPVVGSGFWADDRVGACVTTGVGEALARQGTARRCVQLVADGHAPERAAQLALEELVDHPGDVRGASGLILVTRDGAVVLDHFSQEMSGGWIDADGARRVGHAWRTS